MGAAPSETDRLTDQNSQDSVEQLQTSRRETGFMSGRPAGLQMDTNRTSGTEPGGSASLDPLHELFIHVTRSAVFEHACGLHQSGRTSQGPEESESRPLLAERPGSVHLQKNLLRLSPNDDIIRFLSITASASGLGPGWTLVLLLQRSTSFVPDVLCKLGVSSSALAPPPPEGARQIIQVLPPEICKTRCVQLCL